MNRRNFFLTCFRSVATAAAMEYAPKTLVAPDVVDEEGAGAYTDVFRFYDITGDKDRERGVRRYRAGEREWTIPYKGHFLDATYMQPWKT